ncbi:hypothetical protein HYS31_04675 [Candidatus Woesearchaeota archaeon]|nr:hypothetical protein [Candidatus Woesearchaeota archaeon]
MNQQGNPNISEESRKWRERTPDWQDVLAKISKERSTGPRTDFGKFRTSLNALKIEQIV